MAKENLIKTADIDVSARELDFVTRFSKNWDALRKIMGIQRPIKKAPGTQLVAYEVTGELEDGEIGEGENIPYSKFEVKETKKQDVTIEKYSKAVSIEAVNKWGAEKAVQKTDEEFLNKLQIKVLTKFYNFLKTGTLMPGAPATTWQDALAQAQGLVIDKFNRIDRTVTEIVGFANVLDAYEYMGASNISVQTKFGVSYVEDYLGYKTLFLLSEPNIPRGAVLATPVDNIDLYYIDPNDSDFAKLGLVYTVDGETNLIGFHAQGNYGTAVGESFALMGMTLWAEYLDGIAIVPFESQYIDPLTVSSETDAATFPWTTKKASDMQTDVVVSGNKITGTLKFIEGGLAGSGPLAGDGYFMALKWTDPATGIRSLKVGLSPSQGTGLVEAISDTDRNGVMKITDKDLQRFVLAQVDTTGHRLVQQFDLSGLTLEPANGV